MIYLFLADGFEEAEALVPLDILRRAGLNVQTVGIGGSTVTGSHGISVVCDIAEEKVKKEDIEAIILPGGMPGTINLENSACVQDCLSICVEKDLIVGAICAAPSILGHRGMLNGKKATCFTGFEKELMGAIISTDKVVCDGKIVTAVGAGAAFEFGFLLLAKLTDDNTANKLKANMKY